MAPTPGTPEAPRRSRLRHLLTVLGALALGLALLAVTLRVFCLRIFQVTTPSMEPTIHGAAEATQDTPAFKGQGVLVAFGPLFDVQHVERFDLVVIDRGEGTAPFVKRVAGLPGERLQLSGGDLLINGERLAPTDPRPPPISLFSWSIDDFEDNFHYLNQQQGGPWQWTHDASGPELQLDATQVAPGSDRGMALLMSELADDVRLGNGHLQRGAHQVNDGSIAFDVRLTDPQTPGHLRARLVEGGDIFEVELSLAPAGAHARILRYPGGEELASTDFPAPPSATWNRLTFENRDNHLQLAFAPVHPAGAASLTIDCSYAANRPFEAVLPPGLSSIAPRAAFGGDGLSADFKNIEITRDLYWIPIGPWGTRPQIELGPNEYFLLGDNSANSLDSRYWGPIPSNQIIGKPIAIVGPWSDRHWL